MIVVVGIMKPKINIQTIYDSFLALECQSGAHPTPDNSGAYRPQPNNGGRDRQKAYSQVMNNSL